MNTWIKSLDIKVVLAFAAVYIIWGTTYLAIKIGVAEMPPFLMASCRYLIAGFIMLTYCQIKHNEVLKSDTLKNLLLGAFMLSLGQGILFWAEKYLSSGLTAVFIATLPIAYIIVDRKNWKGYFNSKLTIISIVMGLAGILVLFKDQTSEANTGGTNMQLIASVVVVCSCLCWAMGSIYYKNNSDKSFLFCDVGWQLIGGSIACILISIFADSWATFTFQQVSIQTWGAVFYLAVAGSIVAFTASYYLLSVRPPAIVGTYAYVNPIIAVILGFLVAGESISISQIIGIVIILVAAYLSNKVKFISS